MVKRLYHFKLGIHLSDPLCKRILYRQDIRSRSNAANQPRLMKKGSSTSHPTLRISRSCGKAVHSCSHPIACREKQNAYCSLCSRQPLNRTRKSSACVSSTSVSQPYARNPSAISSAAFLSTLYAERPFITNTFFTQIILYILQQHLHCLLVSQKQI